MPQVFGQFKNDWEGASESVTGLFSIPLGYWLLSGSASRFNYTTQIYGLNQAYTSSGTTSAMLVIKAPKQYSERSAPFKLIADK